jgi:hypothetical protein
MRLLVVVTVQVGAVSVTVGRLPTMLVCPASALRTTAGVRHAVDA